MIITGSDDNDHFKIEVINLILKIKYMQIKSQEELEQNFRSELIAVK